MVTRKKRIGFLCTHNSCRSQMAEGLLRHYGGERFEVFSGGTPPSGIHPMAEQVMGEKGIDPLGQRSKPVDEFLGEGFDLIVTTCDDARDKCPAFPGQGPTLHWDLRDPSEAQGSKEKKLKAFRRVRNELENLTRSHFLSEYR